MVSDTPPGDHLPIDHLSLEEAHVDREQVEVCIGELRQVVGDDMARDDLYRAAVAADCNTNRALNFIFQ